MDCVNLTLFLPLSSEKDLESWMIAFWKDVIETRIKRLKKSGSETLSLSPYSRPRSVFEMKGAYVAGNKASFH